MISYHDALTKINNDVSYLNTETIDLENALNRIVAQNVRAKVSNPNFDNSAMDGLAVYSEDLQDASVKKPISLEISDIISAGDTSVRLSEKKGTACEIMTGARIPDRADAVIKIEDVSIKDKLAIFTRPTEIGNNIRREGEDFKQGDLMISTGNKITAEHIMLLASAGICQIKVYKKIKIAIISTGKELISRTEELGENKIYDSNSPYLESIIRNLNIEGKYFGNVYDDKEAFIAKISQINNEYHPDIIISTGAVSKGKWDFIPDTLQDIGFNIIFHKAAIRPGKPILFAKSQTGYYFGLPGNPRAVTVGFRFFIYPLICTLQHLNSEEALIAKLKSSFFKKNKLTFFVVGQLAYNKHGELEVDILQTQESFRVLPNTIGNCFVMLTEEAKEYKAGELVNIYRFF